MYFHSMNIFFSNQNNVKEKNNLKNVIIHLNILELN